MRLLNIKTLRLESYANTENTPPYAILSHTWGVEEVLFDDLQEQPHTKDFLDLQSRFDDLERRFLALQSRLDSLNSGTLPRGTESPSSQPETQTKPENDGVASEEPRLRRV